METQPQAPRGTTPFTDPILADLKTQAPQSGIRCGTGDSFVQGPDYWFVEADIDIVDMEGYALAYVAKQYDIPFRSFKYVSDLADENAMQDWSANIAKGAELFYEKIRNGI